VGAMSPSPSDVSHYHRRYCSGDWFVSVALASLSVGVGRRDVLLDSLQTAHLAREVGGEAGVPIRDDFLGEAVVGNT